MSAWFVTFINFDCFLNVKWKTRFALTRVLYNLLFIGEVDVLFWGMVCGTIWLAGEFDSNSACSLLLSTMLRTLSAVLLLSAWCLSCTCISCFKSKISQNISYVKLEKKIYHLPLTSSINLCTITFRPSFSSSSDSSKAFFSIAKLNLASISSSVTLFILQEKYHFYQPSQIIKN